VTGFRWDVVVPDVRVTRFDDLDCDALARLQINRVHDHSESAVSDLLLEIVSSVEYELLPIAPGEIPRPLFLCLVVTLHAVERTSVEVREERMEEGGGRC
jgi:hypothetical protein